MILLLAVVAGLFAGLARGWFRGQHLKYPEIEEGWLVFIAVIPQLLVFNTRTISHWIPLQLSIGILIVSQVMLIWFAWLNRSQQGFWILGIGLSLNFLVIVVNGGLMPIRPDAVMKVYPTAPLGVWQIGERLGSGKDIVLPIQQTRLWFLSDYFVFAKSSWFRVAFSIGDILIGLGTFIYLWSLGGQSTKTEKGLVIS
ncbi:MAG TPA: DUF5317 domain-containing protein [Anaerolineae bacterium]|nr:DUF5317 domain-containing protein [Anaerolineae bacterium]